MNSTEFGPDDFARATNVSRETLDRLRLYVDLLSTWTEKINLIAPSTRHNIWHRHLLDCAQLGAYVPSDCRRLADLGSGAGLPGLVLAILGAAGVVHLVESDQRKCAFLREAARTTETSVTIHAKRVENLAPLEADVICARAFAPLESLLPLAARHAASRSAGGTRLMLPKGRRFAEELTDARKRWHI